jgi:hypothetical protein
MRAQAQSGSSAITVWIERADGTILRGRAQTVSARGARVLLPGRCALLPDEPVVLRVCFSPERPTVAASAQVRWARQLGEVDCGLDWDLGTVEFSDGGPDHPGAFQRPAYR